MAKKPAAKPAPARTPAPAAVKKETAAKGKDAKNGKGKNAAGKDKDQDSSATQRSQRKPPL
ncbi:MAG TPA: alpha/beta hydrolase, partial [Thermosynergistes sp.]|nr:alpha/beta hydrolase [Thermosynergistes sp.]